MSPYFKIADASLQSKQKTDRLSSRIKSIWLKNGRYQSGNIWLKQRVPIFEASTLAFAKLNMFRVNILSLS